MEQLLVSTLGPMTPKPFSLAVKAVALDSQKRCLLIRRSARNRNFEGKWEWPGGKVDSGETFAMAVLREAREETSLEVEITSLAGATEFEMPAVHVILICLEVRVLRGEIKLSEEHDAFEWVPLSDFPRYAFPEQVRESMLTYALRKASGHARTTSF